MDSKQQYSLSEMDELLTEKNFLENPYIKEDDINKRKFFPRNDPKSYEYVSLHLRDHKECIYSYKDGITTKDFDDTAQGYYVEINHD